MGAPPLTATQRAVLAAIPDDRLLSWRHPGGRWMFEVDRPGRPLLPVAWSEIEELVDAGLVIRRSGWPPAFSLAEAAR